MALGRFLWALGVPGSEIPAMSIASRLLAQAWWVTVHVIASWVDRRENTSPTVDAVGPLVES